MIKEILEFEITSVVELQDSFKDGWSENSLKSSLQNGLIKIFGEYQEGELVGFISLGISDILDVETIFVKKDYRKRGIAFQLLGKAFDTAKEVDAESVMLEVRESNVPAISLYKKAGFKYISSRKGYYFDGENALVFKKEIKK